MRRKPLIVAVAAGALAVAAVPAVSAVTLTGQPQPAKVTVRPAVGTPHTRFAVTFLTPRAVGLGGAVTTRYAVTASDRRRRGCAWSTSAVIASSRPTLRLKLSLAPPPASGWCAGRFSARIEEYQSPICGPVQVCPQFIRFVGTVAKFSFRVKRGS
jgi:hypothetical protein